MTERIVAGARRWGALAVVRRNGAGAVVLVAALLLLAPQALAKPQALGVRVGDHPDKTRFVVELDTKVPYSIFTLPDPYRVVVDMPDVDWKAPEMGDPGKNRAIKDYRFGLFARGHSRIVLDLKQPMAISKAFMLPPTGATPWRFVLDLKPTTRAAFVADKAKVGAGFTAPDDTQTAVVAPPPPKPSTKPLAQRKPVIVVDAGHGGPDPGTIGVSGMYEKHITLAMARELKDALEASGKYRVVLTRDRDIFIKLRDRVAIARAAGADLFISLHADSIKNRKIRGLSVYTLSEKASDKEAARLAEKENKADLIAGVDLSVQNREVADILLDLAQRETMNMSAHYAGFAIRSLSRQVSLLRRTHRFASFAVLKAPDVPSVLIELGYLSNPTEEKNLRRRDYRAKLARGITAGVDQFFSQTQKALLP